MFIKNFKADDVSLIFEIKASSNAYIGLVNNGVFSDKKMYEILLGGVNNTLSCIRTSKNGNCNPQVDTTNILNKLQFRYFWIKIKGKKIYVGRGNKVDVDTFMK